MATATTRCNKATYPNNVVDGMTTTHLSQGSSELFDSDPEFLDALASVDLPTAIPYAQRAHTHGHSLNPDIQPTASSAVPKHPSEGGRILGKRSRSSSPLDIQASYVHHLPSDSATQGSAQNADDIYGPSKFGGFDEYMRRKRAKLQIQNTALAVDGEEPKPNLFKGVQIYVCMHDFQHIIFDPNLNPRSMDSRNLLCKN